MPSVSGNIKYRAYTLYLTVSMAEMFPHSQLPPFLSPSRGLGLIIDPDAPVGRTVLALVMDHEDEFLEHLSEQTPPGSNVMGMMVWKGDIIVDPEGEVEFKGTLRRPLPRDFREYSKVLKRLDEIAHEEALEHARHCRRCAAEMGLDPSEIAEDADDSEGHLMGIWTPAGIGEA